VKSGTLKVKKQKPLKTNALCPLGFLFPAIRIVDKPLLISRERIVQPPASFLNFTLQIFIGRKERRRLGKGA